MSVEVGLVTYNALSDLFQSEYFVILLWKSVNISSPQMNIYTHTYIHYIDVHLINFSLYIYLFSLLLIKPWSLVQLCLSFSVQPWPQTFAHLEVHVCSLRPSLYTQNCLFLNRHKIPHPFTLRSPSNSVKYSNENNTYHFGLLNTYLFRPFILLILSVLRWALLFLPCF